MLLDVLPGFEIDKQTISSSKEQSKRATRRTAAVYVPHSIDIKFMYRNYTLINLPQPFFSALTEPRQVVLQPSRFFFGKCSLVCLHYAFPVASVYRAGL